MNNSCRHCGKEAAEGALYCPQCADSSGTVKIRKIWLFAISFSILLLVLAVMLLWSGNCCKMNLSWDDFTGKPAALINGETVSRKELRTRSDAARRMIERQSGDIFTGEIGQERLAALKRQVLDRIIEERLVAQEARRVGITITDVMVEDELRRIGREINGAGENIQKVLESQGINKADLQTHVRQVLTFQALAKAKIAQADKGVQPDAYLADWLGQVKKTAKVVVYDSTPAVASTPARGGGCCGSGANVSPAKTSGCGGQSGCGSGKTPGQVDAATEKKAVNVALAEYRKNNPAEKDVTARVSDYGCHIQVDIEKGGRAIWSYSYQDGKVIEN